MTVATAPATFFTIAGHGADYYWRVTAPAKVIGAKSHLIDEDVLSIGDMILPSPIGPFRWRVHDDDGNELTEEDDFGASGSELTVDWLDLEGNTAVWTRPDGWRAIHAELMRRHGIRTVSEVDDNYLAAPKFNVFMKSNSFDADRQADHLHAVASMDAVIVTTDLLRDIYWKAMVDRWGRRRVPPIHVCGNHLFLDDWPEVPLHVGKPRVGWMGSPSHVWDVDLAWPAMLYARSRGCETTVVGYNPGDPIHDFEVTSDRAKVKADQWKRAIDHYVPWHKMETTQRLPLPFEIGLAPLQTNEFTLGKSDIKAVEYVVAGAVPVLSNMPVYNRTWVHGETCLLAGSPQEMLNHVEWLIDHPKERLEILERAQQYVREERTIEKHRDEWMEAVVG